MNPAQREKKLREGDELLKQGTKLVTKTMLRWKPDHEQASPLFDKAAICFKNAKAYDKAKMAFQKAAVSQIANDVPHAAAKSLEAAAGMAKELKDLEEAAELYRQSSTQYRVNGTTTKGAEILTRAAKMLEESNVPGALELYRESCDLYEAESKEHFAQDTFKQATALCVRNQMYEDAIEFIERQSEVFKSRDMKTQLHKAFLSCVVLRLALEDFVAAERGFQKYAQTEGFAFSEEGRACSELLDVFERADEEALAVLVKKHTFTYLDPAIVKLARSLKITVEFGVAARAVPSVDDMPDKSDAAAAAAAPAPAAPAASAADRDALFGSKARPAASDAAARDALFGGRKEAPAAAPAVDPAPEPVPEPAAPEPVPEPAAPEPAAEEDEEDFDDPDGLL